MTTHKQREQIIESLKSDPQARAEFVAAHIEDGIPLQIRANRVGRSLSQAQLGTLCDMKQTAISRLEGDSGGLPNLDTLLRLASAFDCALIVRFAPFSELIDWGLSLGKRPLAAQSFAGDKALHGSDAIVSLSSSTGRQPRITHVAVRTADLVSGTLGASIRVKQNASRGVVNGR